MCMNKGRCEGSSSVEKGSGDIVIDPALLLTFKTRVLVFFVCFFFLPKVEFVFFNLTFFQTTFFSTINHQVTTTNEDLEITLKCNVSLTQKTSPPMWKTHLKGFYCYKHKLNLNINLK